MAYSAISDHIHIISAIIFSPTARGAQHAGRHDVRSAHFHVLSDFLS
jgi:hypothetical protein